MPERAERDGCWKEGEAEWRIDISLPEREREKEQREANTNPLIKATTASLEPAPDINT